MKYIKCPRCEVNYILPEEKICKICKEESEHGRKEENDEFICPFCYKNPIGFDEIMCEKCAEKRAKSFGEVDT